MMRLDDSRLFTGDGTTSDKVFSFYLWMNESVIGTRHADHGAKAGHDAVEREIQQVVLVVLGHCQLTHSLGGKALGCCYHRVVLRKCQV